ncbi:hypothetical protein AALP_AA1G273600 [Arabis alpina]|uniref:Uncharacterized protein n=1 Tax=Arabis alpina TaxID=50452 RepID=A0A087HR12_ARAAL|nr:hypothetical protein AALP_AA1G273600 [Arabis alpina]
MNPSTDQASVTVDELAPPSQPHRLSTSCNIHPNEQFSGFCPSCLCERLTVLDHTGATPPPSSSSRKPPTATLKALFKPSSSSNSNNNNANRVKPGFFPELRRTKSFSAKNNEGFSGGFEPQRRSCDVRLTTVIVSDEARKSSVSEAVLEVNEEEADTEEAEENEFNSEIVEEVEVMKPMKEYMDLYPQSQTKKPSFTGSLFSAASVFNKKLQKWRQKKTKKPRNSNDRDRPTQPHTQSEIADYGFGRRSSDTDPRFSLDAGRFSVDIGRISLDDSRFDQPRASWDGHLTGKSTLPPPVRLPPPPSMLSVVKNAPVNQSDMQIPLEYPINRKPDPINRKPDPINGKPEPINREFDPINGKPDPINRESDPVFVMPGGSTQTKDYYKTEPPPSRRRKSLDRSNSIKRTEIEEFKSVSNSKVSPAITERDDYSMETTENKKSKRWGKWRILGFIYRKGVNDEEDKYSRSNSTGMVERSLSESWPEMRNEPKMRRSNSNVSWRNKSGRFSSKDGDNGMLRFYLTPSLRNGGGGGGDGGGWKKTAVKANTHGHSIARRVMRLY